MRTVGVVCLALVLACGAAFGDAIYTNEYDTVQLAEPNVSYSGSTIAIGNTATEAFLPAATGDLGNMPAADWTYAIDFESQTPATPSGPGDVSRLRIGMWIPAASAYVLMEWECNTTGVWHIRGVGLAAFPTVDFDGTSGALSIRLRRTSNVVYFEYIRHGVDGAWQSMGTLDLTSTPLGDISGNTDFGLLYRADRASEAAHTFLVDEISVTGSVTDVNDADDNGVADAEESGADPDGDGIINSLEDVLGTDRYDDDTDNDGVDDGDEVMYNGNPDYDPYNPVSDTGTDLNVLEPDTDDDGVNDGAELSAGTDPLDDTDFPIAAPVAGLVSLAVLGAAVVASGGLYARRRTK